MKRFFLLLAACTMIAAGCKGGPGKAPQAPADPSAEPVAAENGVKADAGQDFSFDELFKIFSLFGDNIMSAKFAPQSVKDGIREELKGSYDGYTEFIGPCNHLAHSVHIRNYNHFHSFHYLSCPYSHPFDIPPLKC